MSFEGKVILITAASKGIGAATASLLAEKGANVVLMARSSDITSIASQLNGIGIAGDTSNTTDLENLVALATTTYGKIDGLVNNTGHPPKGQLLSISDEEWRKGMDLVLMNVIRLARLVTPLMKNQGAGSIVNISTFSAFEPSAKFPVSSTFRAALGSYTKLYADEYGPQNIRMNNILPGYVDSYPITDEIKGKIPLQRSATTLEIANATAFLLSDEASYITGQNLRVDGGITRSV